jgi:hypothetical protein
MAVDGTREAAVAEPVTVVVAELTGWRALHFEGGTFRLASSLKVTWVEGRHTAGDLRLARSLGVTWVGATRRETFDSHARSR